MSAEDRQPARIHESASQERQHRSGDEEQERPVPSHGPEVDGQGTTLREGERVVGHEGEEAGHAPPRGMHER